MYNLSATFPSDTTFASMYFSFQTIHNIVYVYMCTLSTTFPSVNFHSNATFPPMQCISQFLHTINTVFNYICTLPATFASVHFHSDTNIAPMHFCSQTLHNDNLVWILYTWALPANRTAMHFHSKPTLPASFPNSL